MEIKQNLRIPIHDRSQIAEARRIIHDIAVHIGFEEKEVAKIAIVGTELTTNLLRHAQKGEILIHVVHYQQSPKGLDLIALDHGPGIRNLPEAMRDGFSTYGGSGTGLGAVSRLSLEFDIYSQPNQGSAILARFLKKDNSKVLDSFGIVNLPKQEEKVSGDDWSFSFRDSKKSFLVVDGLGHGLLAAEAAKLAVQVFEMNADQNPADILDSIHDGLRSTRGAAAAISEIDFTKRIVTYAGIGNINSAIITANGSRRLVSHNGTLGHEVHRLNEFVYEFPEGAALLMHSDGLGTQWDMNKYPGLLSRHPSLITSVLYRDFHKERDDVTVLFSKFEPNVNS
jgi:anti-sigma regulatory factor (Ser/Thr protein kinase)